MSMQVKPGYTNPLLTMKEHGAGSGTAKRTGSPKNGAKDKVKELQMMQQQLQSEMLLMKSTGTDTSGNSVEKLEKMENRLDEVTNDLRTAKKDFYVKEDKDQEAVGIYQAAKENGKRVIKLR